MSAAPADVPSHRRLSIACCVSPSHASFPALLPLEKISKYSQHVEKKGLNKSLECDSREYSDNIDMAFDALRRLNSLTPALKNELRLHNLNKDRTDVKYRIGQVLRHKNGYRCVVYFWCKNGEFNFSEGVSVDTSAPDEPHYIVMPDVDDMDYFPKASATAIHQRSGDQEEPRNGPLPYPHSSKISKVIEDIWGVEKHDLSSLLLPLSPDEVNLLSRPFSLVAYEGEIVKESDLMECEPNLRRIETRRLPLSSDPRADLTCFRKFDAKSASFVPVDELRFLFPSDCTNDGVGAPPAAPSPAEAIFVDAIGSDISPR